MQEPAARRNRTRRWLIQAVAVPLRAEQRLAARGPRRPLAEWVRARVGQGRPEVKAASLLAHSVHRRAERVGVRARAVIAPTETIRRCGAALTLSATRPNTGRSLLLRRNVRACLRAARLLQMPPARARPPAFTIPGRTRALCAFARAQVCPSHAPRTQSFPVTTARRLCRTRARHVISSPEPCVDGCRVCCLAAA